MLQVVILEVPLLPDSSSDVSSCEVSLVWVKFLLEERMKKAFVKVEVRLMWLLREKSAYWGCYLLRR